MLLSFPFTKHKKLFNPKHEPGLKLWLDATRLSANDGERLTGGDLEPSIGTAGWSISVGDGAVANEAVIVQGGANAAKITSGPTANSFLASPAFAAASLRVYMLRFWTRGDGTNAGRYQVLNADTLAEIVATTSTGITGTSYTQVVVPFVVPSGCKSVGLKFYGPTANGGIAYFDTLSVLPIADADSVTTWPDLSGNGYDAAQATAANKPTYKTGIQNGKPVVRFDGGDFLSLSGSGLGILRNVAGATLIAVAQTTRPGTGSPSSIFTVTTNVTTTARFSTIREYTVASNLELRCRRLDADAVAAINGANFRETDWNVLTHQTDYANRTALIRKDSVQLVSSAAYTSAGSTEDTASAAVMVGAFDSVPTYPINGDIGEVLVFDRALNAGTIRRIELYLARKWGIGLGPAIEGTPSVSVILGDEIAAGALTVGSRYEITATQVNYFYTGCLVGDRFWATAATVLDANNKVKLLTNSLAALGDFGAKNGEYRCVPTVTDRRQAGMWACSLADNSYRLGFYVDRVTGKAHFWKGEAGTYTELTSGNVTYGAAKVLELVVQGATQRLYYDGVLVGAEQAVTLTNYGTLVNVMATNGGTEAGKTEVRK